MKKKTFAKTIAIVLVVALAIMSTTIPLAALADVEESPGAGGEAEYTNLPYEADGDVEITDESGVTYDDDAEEFRIPAGVTEFKFTDDGTAYTATYDDESEEEEEHLKWSINADVIEEELGPSANFTADPEEIQTMPENPFEFVEGEMEGISLFKVEEDPEFDLADFMGEYEGKVSSLIFDSLDLEGVEETDLYVGVTVTTGEGEDKADAAGKAFVVFAQPYPIDPEEETEHIAVFDAVQTGFIGDLMGGGHDAEEVEIVLGWIDLYFYAIEDGIYTVTFSLMSIDGEYEDGIIFSESVAITVESPEEEYTHLPYEADGDVEITDESGVTYDDDAEEFRIPAGVTEFKFTDDGTAYTATYDDESEEEEEHLKWSINADVIEEEPQTPKTPASKPNTQPQKPSGPAPFSTAAYVTNLYKNILGRDPDAGGYTYWLKALENGTKTATQVVYGFMFSAEMNAKNLSNEDFVETLYQAFFGRASDQNGKANWVRALNVGATREQVFEGFAGSLEFILFCNAYGITR
ncbi:MAG: DUF4214 domain-containing protein [Oscillospiraceae bacterium]|nr:DUF4214 domain-containing protein [Oscillospiraceae bacterium]